MAIFFKNRICILQPGDLLKQYEKLDKDRHRFVYWMKAQCHANAGHARRTYDIVKSFTPDQMVTPTSKKEIQVKENQRKFSQTAPLLMLPMPKKPIVVTDADQKTPIKSNNMVVQPTQNSTGHKVLNDVGAQRKFAANSDVDKSIEGKNALKERLFKLNDQFRSVNDTANVKMVELQSELGKMHQMSREFNVLAEFLASEEKLSTFEENLDRLQKTVQLTEGKINEINTNNQKVRRMIRDINEAAKKQYDNNEKAINTIGERLTRWESKLDRVARKLSDHKVDFGDLKLNGSDFEQLKGDFDGMLLNNERLNGLSADMKIMKTLIFSVTLLIVLKTVVFDYVQTYDFNAKN